MADGGELLDEAGGSFVSEAVSQPIEEQLTPNETGSGKKQRRRKRRSRSGKERLDETEPRRDLPENVDLRNEQRTDEDGGVGSGATPEAQGGRSQKNGRTKSKSEHQNSAVTEKKTPSSERPRQKTMKSTPGSSNR